MLRGMTRLDRAELTSEGWNFDIIEAVDEADSSTWLATKDCMKAFNVSRATVRDFRVRGDIEFKKVRSHIVFYRHNPYSYLRKKGFIF